MHVVLVEPQIPPNTGNIARLCAATKLPLHLVGKLGFKITDSNLKRAGLDYWKYTQVCCYPSLEEFLEDIPPTRLALFSKRANKTYVEATFREGDFLVFGSETKGLPSDLLERYSERTWRIPIFHPKVRSLNLSSAVALVVYEALRQIGRLQD